MPDARSLYKQAFEHFANGRLDEAVDTYRLCLEAEPGYANAWNGLAMALQRRGDLEAALEAGRKLVELDPDDPLGHTTLSRILVDMGRIPEAEEERAVAMRLTMRAQGG